ncbi:MAG: histidinol dehydrogenase [Spirochaetaceae bacterium]|jgi:histidinol dehydrogenase/sulfopropanediol 3-dehydrogenase|nr:histidinol dehydrogenase [Spirochaetaceae bacterium]
MRVIKQSAKSAFSFNAGLSRKVSRILAKVKKGGEAAVLKFEKKFSGANLKTVSVSKARIKAAYNLLNSETIDALHFSAGRILEFAKKQKECILPLNYQSLNGAMELGHSLRPVERCGCYVPAGRHPLPSSALMSVITAKAAGTPYAAACSPPFSGNSPGGCDIHPAVLAALDIAGADEVFCMGGAQAVAAFAYGAGPVPAVDLIAGPGNRFVTEAKRQILGIAGIDSLAGPSEVLIIADESARADFIAADLLAQAEHDSAAIATLVTTSLDLAREVERRIEESALTVDASGTASRSWRENGGILLADSIDEAIEFANAAAPEHLELQVAPGIEKETAQKLKAYGSLFAGHYAPTAFGDFVSGTNHILPTMGAARFSSGLWVGSFLRVQFNQFVSWQACEKLAGPCAAFANIEGLNAHAESVKIRRQP